MCESAGVCTPYNRSFDSHDPYRDSALREPPFEGRADPVASRLAGHAIGRLGDPFAEIGVCGEGAFTGVGFLDALPVPG